MQLMKANFVALFNTIPFKVHDLLRLKDKLVIQHINQFRTHDDLSKLNELQLIQIFKLDEKRIASNYNIQRQLNKHT